MNAARESNLFRVLSTLKVKETRLLGEACGISTSRTKGDLCCSVQDALRKPTSFQILPPCSISRNSSLRSNHVGTPQNAIHQKSQDRMAEHDTVRILSIDMGIRNLAFSVLEVPTKFLTSAEIKTTTNTKDSDCLKENDVPVTQERILHLAGNLPSVFNWPIRLVEWKRQDLYALLSTIPSDDQQESDKTQDIFDAFTLSKLTYNLVTKIFLPYNISHVLVERQRYRSGGAAAVQNWTIRVNMFESMLHSVFGTLRRWSTEMAHLTRGKGTSFVPNHALLPRVHAVDPKKVISLCHDMGSDFGLQPPENHKSDEHELGIHRAKQKISTSVEQKKYRMQFAESLLRNEQLTCDFEASCTKSAFLAARNKRQGRSQKGKNIISDSGMNVIPEKKLDDLADCLVQGIAWLQWEINRTFLAQNLGFYGQGPSETSRTER